MSQQFYGGLSSFFLQLRHINVINEDGNCFVRPGSKDSFPLFVEFRLNSQLGFFWLGLSWEVEENRDDWALSFPKQERDNKRGFSHTWITSQQNRFFVLQQQIEHMFKLESINSRHHNIVVLSSFDELKLLKSSFPADVAGKVIRVYEEIK